jgi:geranylgeranyl pyrophosphate synthase
VRTLVLAEDPDRAELGHLLLASGSVQYALSMAADYVKSACDRIAVLEDTPAKRTLTHLAEMILSREL